MVEVSREATKNARAYKLKPEELAFADLLAAGWDATDAYSVAIRTGAVTWTKEALADEIKRISEIEGVKKRIYDLHNNATKEMEQRIREAVKLDDKELLRKATSKEDKLIELQAAADAATVNSPEWFKANQMIVDISKMKQDEIKTDDNTVHYFLPVSYPSSCQNCLYSKCKECKYYRYWNKNHEKD